MVRAGVRAQGLGLWSASPRPPPLPLSSQVVGQSPGMMAEAGEADEEEEEEECPALHAHPGIGGRGMGGSGQSSDGGSGSLPAAYSALVGEGEEGSGGLTPSSDALLAHALLESEEGMGVAEGISVADLLTPNTSRSRPSPFGLPSRPSPFALTFALDLNLNQL